MITAIAIVAASLIFYFKPFGQRQVKVPPELILGQVIDSSNVRLEFPESSEADFVQFQSNKEINELAEFYTKAFSVDGWSVIQTFGTASPVQIVAANQGKRLRANVGIVSFGTGPTLVAITFRKN